jgi:hypothetical protein
MTLQERAIDVLTMPLPPDAEVLHPDRAVLAFGQGYSFDLGAFCYAKRSSPVGPRKNCDRPKSERLVDPRSLIPARALALRRTLHYFSDLMTSGGTRPGSVFALARHYAAFVEWAEANAPGDVLLETDALRQALAAYVEHLRHTVATGSRSQNTAAIAQNAALAVAADLSGVGDLHHGLNLLRIDKHAREATEPPPEDAQARVLALCQSLFDGLSELCLDFGPYPFALSVPPSVGAPGNRLWLFPAMKWCMAPHEMATRESLKYGFWAYDYTNGRVATVEEIAHRYVQNPAKGRREAPAETTIRDATRKIAAANADRQDGHRRNAALLAHHAFIVLFLAHTGMNWSSVQSLPWTGEHELGAERQGFRAVKYRAGGRLVSFEIQAGFLPTFRRFLRLRDYLLNGEGFDRLFIASGNAVKRFEPLKAKALTSIFDSLRRIEPGLPDIKSKQWRAGKSDWLLRKTDPATTAAVLQNSEATVLASYAAGSPTTQGDEMTAFFDRLQSAVLERGAVVPDGVPNAVGVCASYGHPNQVLAAPVDSDCKWPEGCLFCDKFKVHADEKDTRKLVSCRYCIQQTAHMVVSEEHFQVLFGPLLKRIAGLLAAIDQREPGLVARIEQEVEEGELDPYWASKLEMLVDLELVA